VTDPSAEHGDQPAIPTWAAAVPPQARGFQGHRAGFVTRFVAAAIDMVIVGLGLGGLYLGWAVVLFAVNPSGFTAPTFPFGGVLIVAAALGWLYFTLAWATTGRTLGSRLLGIRVVNFRGRVMRLGGAAVRAAFCLAFLPGLFWVIVSSENRSLQDTLLRTSVIHDWTKRPPTREKSTPM
jgi:uncharacterized RDD family membrane protein YckC